MFRRMVAHLLIFTIVCSLVLVQPLEVRAAGGSFAGGTGSVTDPYIITTVTELVYMNEHIASVGDQYHYYKLEENLDLIEDEWSPIGLDDEFDFFGHFDGNNKTISNMRIGIDSSYLGLFKTIAEESFVHNLNLSDVEITSDNGYYIGGIAAFNEGTIENSSVGGNISGNNDIGGIAGYNYGTIENSSVGGNISGNDNIGGIAGYNYGSIENSYTTGDVDGDEYVGGVSGWNDSSIKNSYATGNVEGQSNLVGGLVGLNFSGDIMSSNAQGSVKGKDYVGGLVGFNFEEISDSYATGDVTSINTTNGGTGGLAGGNLGTLTDTSATGNVTGVVSVGGLVGINKYEIYNSYATGNVTAGKGVEGHPDSSVAGGLVGFNLGQIYESFSTSVVTGEGDTVGGLVGYNGDGAVFGMNSYVNASIENSFATGAVTGENKVGGLVGRNNSGTIENTYAVGAVQGDENIGGLVGHNSEAEDIVSSYYDTNTTGFLSGDHGVGKATTDMKLEETFEEWDFEGIWSIHETITYPLLKSLSKTVSFESIGGTAVESTLVMLGSKLTAPAAPTKSGYSFAGWYKDENLNTAWNFAIDRVLDHVDLYAKWTTISIQPDPETSTPQGDGNATGNNKGVDVIVNGKVETLATATTSTENNRTKTTVVMDEKAIEDKLNSEGQRSTVIIPVSTNTNAVVAEINGRLINNMEQKETIVEIKTDKASYIIPAQQININTLSQQFGTDVQLQDIKINIEIAEPNADSIQIVENAATAGGFSIVLPPLNFTVKAVFGDRTIDVSKFDVYVERMVAIPDGVDPTKITTGVVIEPDGSVRHVPTQIIQIDGKYYAKIHSLTNSTYSVVWHPLQFKDAEQHWAKDAINDMGSRMVVSGEGELLFSPNADITRAEFASIIVRGLGLRLEQGKTSYTDVDSSAWYSDAVQTAQSYELISGFEDGTFRPMDKISREQAMSMIARAMRITGLDKKLVATALDGELSSYVDSIEVSSWARASVAENLQAGIITGRGRSELAPKAYITRAEVAMIMQKLLKKSELI